MDYSSLAEPPPQPQLQPPQPPQLPQLPPPPQQQQFLQHQSDQHQHHDPSQAQAYDAYYSYEQHYDAYAYPQQPYYSHDYSSSNVAAYGCYYAASQPDSASIRPDGAHVNHSGLQGAAYATVPEQDRFLYQVPPGMNQAAVAALTQLSHLAGSIEAAERAMVGLNERQWDGSGEGIVPMHAQQNYPHPVIIQLGAPIRPGVRGMVPWTRGGRRGGVHRGRGQNRVHTGQHPSGRDTGPFLPRGRGLGHTNRARARGRQLHRPAPEPKQHQTAVVTSSAPPISTAPDVPQPLSTPRAQQRSLLPVAWCDLCRVDCNTKEILEQHKNGKRHKRTLQRVQQIQTQQMAIAGLHLTAASIPQMCIQVEHNHTPMASKDEIETTQALTVPTDEANKVIVPSRHEPGEDEATKGSVSTDTLQNETLETQRVGKKRKMVGYGSNERWHGSKPRMVRVQASKDRPRDQPRVCTVCNVTCDTLAVFECHLSGKKHLSRMKRFEGQGSVYGPISVYIPPNQPTAYPIKGPEPVFYGMQTHAALQAAGLQSHNLDSHEPEVNQGPEFPEQVNPAACGDVAVTVEGVDLPENGDAAGGVVSELGGTTAVPSADSELPRVEGGN